MTRKGKVRREWGAFVDALAAGDRSAVVDFDRTSKVLAGLTADKAALHAGIDAIDSKGDTDVGAGVSAGLGLLPAASAERLNALILLTDGDGSFNNTLLDTALASKAAVFAVGLGASSGDRLLKRIASGTGGRYFGITSASELPTVFRSLAACVNDPTPEAQVAPDDCGRVDSDTDGLPDCIETGGFLLGNGKAVRTNPTKPDSDFDGLPDGLEAGRPGPAPASDSITVYAAVSDPSIPDSDDDGVRDATELEDGTGPFVPDSDFDTLTDGQEDEQSTAPLVRDSDGDDYEDAYEVSKLDQGFDPLVPTEVQSKASYVKDFALGATCGDVFGFCKRDSVAWLAGNIASGFAVVGDVRDAVSSAFKGDLVGVGFSVGGFIPIAGDGVKTMEGVSKFLRRVDVNSAQGKAAIQLGLSLKVPNAVKIKMLEEVADGLTTLKKSGISDESILRLAKRTNMKELEALAKRARGVTSGNGTFAKGFDAEDALRTRTGSNPFEEVFLAPGARPGDTRGSRKVDAWDPKTGTARESKSGYVIEVRLEKTLEQIAKDRELLADLRVQTVEWHFFASNAGTVGADARILDALDAPPPIPYYLHLP